MGRLSANTDNTKKLILLSYLSYLFRLQLLSEDSYLLKDCRVQLKQKHTQKQSYKTHPLFQKRKPLSCLFTFGNKNKNLYLLGKGKGRYGSFP